MIDDVAGVEALWFVSHDAPICLDHSKAWHAGPAECDDPTHSRAWRANFQFGFELKDKKFMPDQEQDTKRRAGYRLDLVRRLFAVAISLGVGTAIVRADWVTQGRLPHGQEVEQIAIVLLALFATVLSWDGYLMSVDKEKPLNDWPRFAIDVFLVFTYMFLLVTSNHSNFWLPIVCIMYSLYVLWDALTVIQFPTLFDKSPQAGERTGIITVARVYFLAIGNGAGIDRGPLISLVWALYFFSLLGITWKFPSFNVFAALVAAAIGMGFYRRDKAWRRNGVRGFSALERGAITVGLFLAMVLFGCLTGAIHRP